jgi:DNA polymerase-3 subunit epsilon
MDWFDKKNLILLIIINSHMYAIIDIETTGGRAINDRITEIAIFVHDGKQIIDQFSTLINPECSIPYYITQITGITNEMVADAPKFFEVARNIVEITENMIFVGHNVNFDYSFVRNEFKMLGFDYRRKTLCTVRLSRKIIPGLRSYSLGNLCQDLKIPITDRHRAAGDAFATVKLLELLLELSEGSPFIPNKLTNHALLKPIIDKLPQETGVYYFYNDDKELIYIGKSNNIYERILSHLNNNSTKRAIEMKNKISDIRYELTGSELIALLLESDEIKKHKPLYNRSQRRTGNNFGVYQVFDKTGYLCYKIENQLTKTTPLTSFESQQEAKDFMENMVIRYNLCRKLCGLYENSGPCFHYKIHQCNGACIGEEHPILYNQRAQKAILDFNYMAENMIIIDKGRNSDERSVICIESGKYKGFGYISLENQLNNIDSIKEYIQIYNDNKDIKQIIRQYLRHKKVEKIIKY